MVVSRNSLVQLGISVASIGEARLGRGGSGDAGVHFTGSKLHGSEPTPSLVSFGRVPISGYQWYAGSSIKLHNKLPSLTTTLNRTANIYWSTCFAVLPASSGQRYKLF